MTDWYDIIPLSQVHHRIFVGGYAEAAKLAEHNPHAITANLCVHKEPVHPQSPRIFYQHIPFNDGEAIPERQFVKCLGWLKFMYENGHAILINCAAGISRSVTTAASFMHYVGICDFNEALDRIKKARPIANPAPVVLISAKKMLGVFPYDGSMEQVPEHERLVFDAFEWMDAAKAALMHPNSDCPMRLFLMTRSSDNVPRHLIPCTCEKVLTEVPEPTNKKVVLVPVACVVCNKSAMECQCADGYI